MKPKTGNSVLTGRRRVAVKKGVSTPVRPVAGLARRAVSARLAEMLAMPSFIREQKDGVCLAVKLQPRAAKNEIGTALGDELKIKVTAPPVEAGANEALLPLLAETLGCPRGAAQLARGQTSRHKTIRISGLTARQVAEKLSGTWQSR